MPRFGLPRLCNSYQGNGRHNCAVCGWSKAVHEMGRTATEAE